MAAMTGLRRPVLKNEVPGNGSYFGVAGVGASTKAGQEPGSWWLFYGTWLCPYQPAVVSHADSLRCEEKSDGCPIGHVFGTPQE